MEFKPLPTTPEDAADERLRGAIVGLGADGAEARIEAMNRRVLAQWAALQSPATAGAGIDGRTWPALRGKGGRAPWAAAAAGLTLGLALVAHGWLRAPDPALEELLQPDVLSQMAAGEM